MRRLVNKRALPAGAVIFFLVFTGFAIASAGQMAVIELKHRPADEVIPVISPFLGPGDTLSGQDYLLFLNTTPENLTRIQSIIDHLDQASRQLAITVVQGENAIDRLRKVDISGSVTIGDGATVGVGDQGSQPPDAIAIDAQSSRHTTRSRDVQQVVVQNGATATIYVGLSAPVAMKGLTHKGMRYHQVQGYMVMLTGVHVTPRLSGDRVTLEIETQQDQPAGDNTGMFRSDRIQTQIRGRLNEWIEIGSILGTSNRKAAGFINPNSSQQSSHRQVFVKVAEIHP
jgi:hypothetical protein